MAESGVTVANLIATLKLDLSQFQTAVQTLDQSLGRIQQAAGTTGTATGELTGKLGLAESAVQSLGLQGTILGQALTFLLNPITLVGAALLSMEEASRRSLEAMMAHAREIEYMSAVSGAGAERANALVEGLKLMGADSEAAALAMFRMSAEIETGGAGLARLGITLRDSQGHLRTEIDLFLEAQDRISKLGTAQERAAALTDLYGLAGRRLAAVHNENAAALRAFMQEGERVRPWTEETQAQSMALIQANQKLAESWQGLRSELGKLMAGPAAAFKSWLADVVAGAREVATGMRQFLGGTGAFALTETGAGVPLPSASPGAAAGSAAAAPTRRTPADYTALEADLARHLQATEQYYARLEGLRAVDVAKDATDRQTQLQGMLRDLDAQFAATASFYDRRAALVREQFKDLANPAAQLAMTEVLTQKEAALNALRVQSLQTRAQLEAQVFAQTKTLREQEIAGYVAEAEEIYRLDQILAKEEETKADARAAELLAVQIRSLSAAIDQADAAAAAYRQFVEGLEEPFRKAEQAARDFQTQFATIAQFGGIQRGAGVPGVDVTGVQQSAVQNRIQTLLGQIATMNEELRSPALDEQSKRFDDLTAAIERSALEVGTLQSRLQDLQRVNTIKGFFTDIFGGLERAIATSVTGVIQGTTTMQQAWNNLAQSITISIEEVLIKRAFKALEEGFGAMLDQMDARAIASAALRLITSLFGGGYGAALGTSTELTGIPQQGAGVGQAGGIVTRPTFALIGEAGPEAVVPLDRMPGASPLPTGNGSAPPIQVIINNQTASEVTAQDTSQGGQRRIEVFIKDTVNRGMAGGDYDRTLSTFFGLNRHGVGR